MLCMQLPQVQTGEDWQARLRRCLASLVLLFVIVLRMCLGHVPIAHCTERFCATLHRYLAFANAATYSSRGIVAVCSTDSDITTHVTTDACTWHRFACCCAGIAIRSHVRALRMTAHMPAQRVHAAPRLVQCRIARRACSSSNEGALQVAHRSMLQAR
jgi:hypothetical protein